MPKKDKDFFGQQDSGQPKPGSVGHPGELEEHPGAGDESVRKGKTVSDNQDQGRENVPPTDD